MEKFQELLKDKKILGIGLVVFVIVLLVARRRAAVDPGTDPSMPPALPGTGGGGSGGGLGQLPPAIQPIADVVALVFDLDSSVYRENELSIVESSGSGSGGSGAIKLGPFSIGGGGSKSSSNESGFNQKTLTDITNKNKFSFSGSGSNAGGLLAQALAGFQNLIGNSTQRIAQQTSNNAQANQNIGGGNITVKTKNETVRLESGPQVIRVKDTPGAIPVIPQNTGAGQSGQVPGYGPGVNPNDNRPKRWDNRTRRFVYV